MLMRINRNLILLGLILASACAPKAPDTATPVPSVTSVPLQSVAPTAEPPNVTPVESAFAPGNSTAAPLGDSIKSQTVTFDAPDGATITAELYGSGKTAVIYSVMGNCKQGWRELAQLTAAQGLMALTYQWRGCRVDGSVDENEIQKFVDDLRGAIHFMRDQGATKIILAGASLGGCASAKLAVESQASGLIVIASPSEIPLWNFEIEAADMNTEIPKLFITAENDNTVAADKTRVLYDLAAQPKEWQTYPGTAHGTDLFETKSGGELQERILNFILAIATKS